ncbi:hypothetical protein KCU81_g6210, partial [Aureobasidium melanogenum]
MVKAPEFLSLSPSAIATYVRMRANVAATTEVLDSLNDSLTHTWSPNPLEASRLLALKYIFLESSIPSTYGHSQLKTGHPVRSAIHKQLNGRLVLRWVTTWESLLL